MCGSASVKKGNRAVALVFLRLTRCVKDLYDERLMVTFVMVGEYKTHAGVYWLDTETVATAPSTTD